LNVAFIRYVLFYSFCSKRPHKDTGNRPGSAQQSYYELDLQRERSTDTMAQKNDVCIKPKTDFK